MKVGIRASAFMVLLVVAFNYVQPHDLVDSTLVVVGVLATVLAADGLALGWRSSRRPVLLKWGRRMLVFAITTAMVAVYLAPLDSPGLLGLPVALGALTTVLLEAGIRSVHWPLAEG